MFHFFESMSSKYAIVKSSTVNILSIIFWNTLCATLHPNGKQLKLYKPLNVLIVNNFKVSLSIVTCQTSLALKIFYRNLALQKYIWQWVTDIHKFLDIHSNLSRNPRRHV